MEENNTRLIFNNYLKTAFLLFFVNLIIYTGLSAINYRVEISNPLLYIAHFFILSAFTVSIIYFTEKNYKEHSYKLNLFRFLLPIFQIIVFIYAIDNIFNETEKIIFFILIMPIILIFWLLIAQTQLIKEFRAPSLFLKHPLIYIILTQWIAIIILNILSNNFYNIELIIILWFLIPIITSVSRYFVEQWHTKFQLAKNIYLLLRFITLSESIIWVIATFIFFIQFIFSGRV